MSDEKHCATCGDGGRVDGVTGWRACACGADHRALASDGRVDALPETYADGWKRQPDDALAFALFVAMAGGPEVGATVESWASLPEHARDDYRIGARTARAFLDEKPTRAELLAALRQCATTLGWIRDADPKRHARYTPTHGHSAGVEQDPSGINGAIETAQRLIAVATDVTHG